MLDEITEEQFWMWIEYLKSEPLDHLVTRNQLAAILSALTNTPIEQCGAVIEFRAITPTELKAKLKHLMMGNGYYGK